MFKFLPLLLLFSCRTMPEGPCFQEPYLLIDPTAQMIQQHLPELAAGIHLWNQLGAHVRMRWESILPEEQECFNLGAAEIVPMYLHPPEEGVVGHYHHNSLTQDSEIWIADSVFRPGDIASPYVIHIIAHEVGHALKLKHGHEPDAIMYPSSGWNTFLLPSDIEQFTNVWIGGEYRLSEEDAAIPYTP